MSISLPKTIRTSAKISQTAAAALAGVSPTTWRVFEASPDAVKADVRSRCEKALQRIASRVG
jgi:hypothetical protein